MSWQEADALYNYQADNWNERADRLANEQLANYNEDNKEEVRQLLSRTYFLIQRRQALGENIDGSMKTVELVSELHPTKNGPDGYLDAVQVLCDLAIEGDGSNV